MTAERTGALTFDNLPADVAAHCIRMGEPLRVARGTVLAHQGHEAERCYYVRSGYARVTSVASDGRQLVLGFFGPRAVIGQAAAVECAAAYLATTTACQAMELVGWTRAAALQLAERFPDVHARLEALLLRNAGVLVKRLHTVSQARVPQRLAEALLELAAQHGRRDAGGVELAVPLTRDDLAGLTGATLYTVSRVLADWQRQGIVTSRRRRLHLTALARLEALAEGR